MSTDAVAASCEHCAAPVDNPDGEPPYFCCSGCEYVFEVINEQKLDRYYELSDDNVRPRQNETPDLSPQLTEPEIARGVVCRRASQIGEHTFEMTLGLEGVHCRGCVWLVEQLPERLDGVTSARLNLADAELTVRWTGQEADLVDICEWLGSFGYTPVLLEERDSDTRRPDRQLLKQVGISWAIAGNVMMLSVAWYGGLTAEQNPTLFGFLRWAALLLTGGSLAYGGSHFFRRAHLSVSNLIETFPDIRFESLSIDIPISVALLIAFSYSAWITVLGTGEVWFDSVAVLIAALLTARWLQARARYLAGSQAEKRDSVLPSYVYLVSRDDESVESWIEIGQLEPEDHVRVRKGERVPGDGWIVAGSTQIDRSAITGESQRIRVESGDTLEAGAKNHGEQIEMVVEQPGYDSRLGRLMKWVGREDAEPARLETMADRVGGMFVVAVLCIASAVALGGWWVGAHWVRNTVAVLVVSCPCALGLATPLAFAMASRRSATEGMFIKNDGVLEEAHRCEKVVFDKTGTLTDSRMEVVDVEGKQDALSEVASLEHGLDHPVAEAIRRYGSISGRGEDNERTSVEGCGVLGDVNGERLFCGRPGWVSRQTGIEIDVDERQQTPVAVAKKGELLAVAWLESRIRDSARKTIDALNRRGVEVYILSGDTEPSVRRVGKQLGVSPDRAIGDVRPDEKLSFIERLVDQSEESVMMVGDGINDAAALRRADIGLAVRGSVGESLEVADVYAANLDVRAVTRLLEASGNVIDVVKHNLSVSLGYNAVGITVAAAGLITPLIAAVAMPVSSIYVTLKTISTGFLEG